MSRHGFYAALIELPDAKHILKVNSIWANNDRDRAFVFNEVRRVVMTNPDAKYDPTTFLNGPFATEAEYYAFTEKLEAQLNAEDPDRKSVRELQIAGAIDTGARLLHDPEIARMLAAQKQANKPTA
jgi:hypothetical protein